MKTQPGKFNPTKIALTAMIMFFSFGLFAKGGGKNDTKIQKQNHLNVAELKKSLGADEAALYDQVSTFNEANYREDFSLEPESDKIDKIIVYDLSGNVLHSQTVLKSKLDLSKLPSNAKLLMKKDGTHYYLVMK